VDEPLGIEVVSAPAIGLIAICCTLVRILLAPRGPQLLQVARKLLPPALLSPELRRQLLPAGLPVALILGLIGRDPSAMISRATRR
jgi:hypothetical protein